ncbi:MAG: YciI family protein [Solirubrobacterales bacterium]
MTIYRHAPSDAMPTEEEMAAMGALIGEMAAAGVLVSTGGLPNGATSFTVSVDDAENDEFTITDGPFAETKEVVGGYAIIEVDSQEEALSWTKRFLKTTGEGSSEVRLMYASEPGEPDMVKGEFPTTAG